ncbi:mucin-2-like isoform X1 [Biomphalaria glabrata]|uniref:Mucin-2-like isoform X1 n=2 Tax=Biomphalaria glabrata TaxID=6526 RepID=A0A9W2ZR15_BIOGL|nr:mucin-2-like isoform X1 [Biomphalaria glabrata]
MMEDHVSSNADTEVPIKGENDAPFSFTVTTLYPKEISDISYSSLLHTELKEELSETSASNITMPKNDDYNEALYLKDNGKNICRNVYSKKSVHDLDIDKVLNTPKRQVLDSRLKPVPMTLVANLHNTKKINRAPRSSKRHLITSKQHAVAPKTPLIAPKEPLLFQQSKELLPTNIEINSSISTLQTSTPLNEPLVNFGRAQNLMIETPIIVGNQTFLIKFNPQILFTPTTVTSYSISTSAPSIAISNSISTPTTVVSSHSISIFSPKIANASTYSLASVCTPTSVSKPTITSRALHGQNCGDVPKTQIQSKARKSARLSKSIKNSNSLKPYETNNPTSYVGGWNISTGQPTSHQCSPIMNSIRPLLPPQETCQFSPKQFLSRPSFPQQTFLEMNSTDQNVSNESTDTYFLSKFTLKQGQLRKRKISAVHLHNVTHVATSSSVCSSNNTSTTGICKYSTPVSNTKTLDSTTLYSLHSPVKQPSHNNPPMSILSSQAIGQLNMNSELKGLEQLKPKRLTFQGDFSVLKKALMPCVVRLEKLNDSSLLQEYLLNKRTEKSVKFSNKLTKVNEHNQNTSELNKVCVPQEGKGEIAMRDQLLDNKDCDCPSGVRNSVISCTEEENCRITSGSHTMSKCLLQEECHYSSENDTDIFDRTDCNSTPALKRQFLKKHRHTTIFLIKHSEMFSVSDDQETYKCSVCKCYKTNGLFRLQKHLKKHIDGFLICSHCGLEAGNEHDLAEHCQHFH